MYVCIMYAVSDPDLQLRDGGAAVSNWSNNKETGPQDPSPGWSATGVYVLEYVSNETFVSYRRYMNKIHFHKAWK